MATILNRLVERLDVKIKRLRKAKKLLVAKNLEDKKLDAQIKRLVAIKKRLSARGPVLDISVQETSNEPNGKTE